MLVESRESLMLLHMFPIFVIEPEVHCRVACALSRLVNIILSK